MSFVVCAVRMEAAEEKLRGAVEEYAKEVQQLNAEAEKTLKRTAVMAEKAAKVLQIVAPSRDDGQVAGSQQTEEDEDLRDPKERKTD
jgi:hypothetical protein